MRTKLISLCRKVAAFLLVTGAALSVKVAEAAALGITSWGS